MSEKTGETFMEKTSFRFAAPSDQVKGLPQPPLELGYDESRPHIELPSPHDVEVPSVTLREAIENRTGHHDHTRPTTIWLIINLFVIAPVTVISSLSMRLAV